MIAEKYMMWIDIAIYIIVGFVIYYLICLFIKNIIKKTASNKAVKVVYKKRQETVLNLIKSVIKYLIVVIVILLILKSFGINTTSFLASLGIAGVIVGLGFQDIVKNLLAGISIIFDDRYMQGDFVKINGFEGEVISLGLQTTKVKSYTGEVMIIENSQITEIINYSMYPSRLVFTFPISAEVDVKLLDKIINNINKKIIEMPEVKSDIEIKGIDSMNADNLIYHIEVLCQSYSYFQVRREINKLLKEEFIKNNISISPEKINVNIKK